MQRSGIVEGLRRFAAVSRRDLPGVGTAVRALLVSSVWRRRDGRQILTAGRCRPVVVDRGT